MAESSDNKIPKNVLNFYDQLSKETGPKRKKSKSTLSLSGVPIKSLKVDAKSVNLSKTLDKIAQKEIDKRKSIRNKNRKAIHRAKKKASRSASIIQESQNSVDFTLSEEINSTSVSLNKSVNNNKDEIDISKLSLESGKLYISCEPQDDDSLLVTLFPNSKIYLIGCYALQVVLGDISVLGYKFKKNEEHIIYSPASHSILSINSLDGCEVKKLDSQKIKDLCIPFEYVQDLDVSSDQPVVIVKIHRYCSNITNMFDESLLAKKKRKNELEEVCLWEETLGVQLFDDKKIGRVSLLCESEEWTSYIEKIQTSLCSSDKRIFVVTGGKSVGKSTFLKYIINSFLSILEVPSVACIDLDPGQPEFSLSGCLTLSVCSSPFLGPSFTHHENYVYSYQKQILFGDISVGDMFSEYLKIVSHLISIYREKFSNIPLIVNTMGFTAVTGYDIMLDIIRILEPTHVINIESLQSNKNFPTQLTSEIVSSTRRGTGILKINYKKLNFNLTTFKSVSRGTKKSKSVTERERNIMGYLSLLWKRNEENLTCYTLKTPHIINWTSFAIHIHREAVPQTHVLLAINASLVALCRMRQEILDKVDPLHPLHIQYKNSSVLDYECLGWGVVRGIDPESQEIHIFTPLDKQTLRRKVNVIAMPRVFLPMDFRNYFSKKNAPYFS